MSANKHEVLVNLPEGQISLLIDSRVMAPSPYSHFLADNLPNLNGADVADLGTGCGIQAIVALKRGAKRVFLLDSNQAAVDNAFENTVRNGFANQVVSLEAGDQLNPLGRTKVDAIICNPSSLPMPLPDKESSFYYAGPEGRYMIHELLLYTKMHLNEGGQLLLVHTSLANLPKTMEELGYQGLKAKSLAQRMIPLRDFYNKHWIDEIGGRDTGLYSLDKGTPYETLHLLKIEPDLLYRPQSSCLFREDCVIYSRDGRRMTGR